MSKSLQIIFLIVGLDAVGFGLVMPIFPDLLRELSHEAEIAHHNGYFLAVYALMQFVFSPVLGALSDRFGRRPVLLVSLVGAAADYVVMGLAPTLGLLYVGRIIAGITGANMAVATSAIADVSTDDDRAKNFGMMHAVFGVGFIVGPLLGGLVGAWSLRYPFLIAALLNGVSFLLGIYALQESLPVEKRRMLGRNALNPFRSLAWVGSMRSLLPFLVVFVILNLAGQMPHSLWTISNQERYGWGPTMIGASFAVYGLLQALVQGFLTQPVTRRVGEFGALLIGLTLECTCYVLFADATQSWMVFAILIPLCCGGIALPALQSIVSRQVSESEQGELQGTMVSLMSLTTIAGPLLFSRYYASLPIESKGEAWLVAAGLYMLSVPLALGIRSLTRSAAAPGEGIQNEGDQVEAASTQGDVRAAEPNSA